MRTLLLSLLWTGCTSRAPEPSPGRVVARRLNRAEYDNTVRDLLGTTQRPAQRFPADDFGLGFDVIAEVLSVSPLHVELYDTAADAMLDELFATGTLPPEAQRIEAESPETRHALGAVWDVTGWVLWDEGAIEGTLWLPMEADYTVSISAFGQQAGDEPVRMALLVDGAEAATFDVLAEEDPAPHEQTLRLTEGRHTFAAAFLNEYKAPPDQDRNLIVDRIEVLGPRGVPRPPSPAYGHVVSCDPALDGEGECAEHIARTFGRRALRRPLSEAEVAAKMRHYAEVRAAGGDWEEGVRALLKSLLLSPYFLYRVEPDPIDGPRLLNGFEIASRLSYFLWSSTPDDRLLDLAQTGALQDPDVLRAEARRLLDDPRSEALVDNLAGQWLGVRKVEEAAPSALLFPDWDEGLLASLQEETRRYVSSILRSDRSALELLTSDETWVDARLAEHYALPAPPGGGFAPVRIPERPGLLARGGLLAALAYPDRTSPVIRGEWVLGNLLCSPPPPPPAGVLPVLAEGEGGSLRERLEQHRADPACAVCHIEMDAIGLALENFDATGRYRTIDELGLPIDATGQIDDLGAFDGAGPLQELLATDPRLPRCMVSKVLTYALGRGPIPADARTEEALLASFAASDYRFESLVVDVVLSRPFRWRTGVSP